MLFWWAGYDVYKRQIKERELKQETTETPGTHKAGALPHFPSDEN